MRIVGGEYSPGEVLPRADALAEELQVSRTVLREAMRVLAEKGLVESRQRAGTRIRDRIDWKLVDPEVIGWHRRAGPDLQFFRDLSDARVAIESTAARLAAQRASEAEIERMRQLFARMEAAVDDPEAHAEADLELHGTILKAARNVLLAQLTDAIFEGLVASRDVTVRSSGASIPATLRAMPLHADVIEAIAARDPERAADCMTVLVEQAGSDIERILGGRADARGPGTPIRERGIRGKREATAPLPEMVR